MTLIIPDPDPNRALAELIEAEEEALDAMSKRDREKEQAEVDDADV